MASRVRLGLVGLNNQGQEHLSGFAECQEASLVAICDQDPDLLADTATAHTQARPYLSIEDLLDHPGLEGLILALPHDVYAKHWNRLAERGLPILKEKPLGRSLSEASRFVRAVAVSGAFLQTAIQRRTHPSYHYLKQALEGRRILEMDLQLHLGRGTEERAQGWRGDFDRAGGGMLLDGGYHLVDLAQFLIGPFELVSATLWRDGQLTTPEQLEDEASVIGCTRGTWLKIHCMRGGRPDTVGHLVKHECVTVETDAGRYVANRERVTLDGVEIFRCGRDWPQAMARQLDSFATNIRKGACDEPELWSQLPAMRLIEEAYALARGTNPLGSGRSNE